MNTSADQLEPLRLKLKQHRIAIEPAFTGKHIRNGSQFFRGEVVEISGKQILTAEFGRWSEPKQKWITWTSAEQGSLTPDEKIALKQTMDTMRAAAIAEQARIHEEVAREAKDLWDAGTSSGEHPYLEKKKLSSLHGSRIFINGFPVLLVPMRDLDGKIWNVTRIYSKEFTDDKTGESRGNKFLIKGGRKQWCFHPIGELDATKPFYFCEGFATGGSIREALGPEAGPVIVCFDAGNVPLVVKMFRKKFPGSRFYVCADNDQWKPEAGNAGLNAAADACSGTDATMLAPLFKDTTSKPTDFNDLACLEGLDAVKGQFATLHEKARLEHEARASGAIVALQGKMSPAKHQQAVDALIRFYGDRIRKQDRDLFIYTGTHWKLLDSAAADGIKRQFQTLFGGVATSEQLSSAYRLFTIHVETVPEGVNLFTPPPWMANFKNGTLHVVKAARRYRLEFKPHATTDWAINVLPYDYQAGDTRRNEEFEQMLDRVFAGDADKPDKIRALRQMYGACLIPAFPHLFMCWGPPGTGKSTAIILAARLIHKDNACSVDPTEFSEFNMETMAGKLVNFDTDIEMHKPIAEKQVKKIIDRVPFRIRRKGFRDIYAPIPSIHIFGGNGIPKTLDGASRAHDRRWTFIGFNALVAKGGYDIDYSTYCFDRSPEGILNFALAGLQDLLDCAGHFTVPASGKAKMEEWQLETDPIGRFFSELDKGQLLDGNTLLMVSPDARIERKRAWEIFCNWLHEGYSIPPKFGRTAFYDRVRAMKFVEKTIRGVDYFGGFGVDVGQSSEF